MNLQYKGAGLPGKFAAHSLAGIAIMFIVLIACGRANTEKQSHESMALLNPSTERRFVHYFSKPPIWRRKNAVVKMTGIGRSEGGMYDGSRFVVYLSGKKIPKGFHLTEDSVTAIDPLGQTLNPWGYSGSWGDSDFEAEMGFELPDQPYLMLRNFECSLDNSYVTQRRYGMYSVNDLKKPLVFKDRRAVINLKDWQVMDIPYEMISDSYVHLTADGKGTVSLVKKLNDKQHGYLVMRCYGIAKDVMIDNLVDLKVSVYGSDNKWHETFTTQNDINCPLDCFASGARYLGFKIKLDLRGLGKTPATVASIDESAAVAGMRKDDIITGFGHARISNLDEALEALGNQGLSPGVPVPVTILRDGKEIELEIVPTEYPLWKGMSTEAGAKAAGQLGKLVGASKDWRSCALAFIMPDPVSNDFKPLKVKLVRGEKVAASKIIPVKFRNIPIPPGFWTAKLVERR